MRNLELSFIGTGNAFATGGRCWNGFVANQKHLFEAPPQALMGLGKLDIDPNGIETVVISHHHGDHLLGLPFLLLHWKYKGRKAPVTIVGPPETELVTRQVSERTYPTLFEHDFEVRWVEARPDETLRLGDLRIEPLEVVHDEKLNLNLGYLCELGGRRFGYTGDSELCDTVLELARKSEVLVTECSSGDIRIPTHMNLAEDIPRLRAAMRAEATLVLTHVDTEVDSGGLPNTFVARDFERYRF